MELLYLIIGLVVGAVAGWLVMRSQVDSAKAQMGITERLMNEQKAQQREQIEQQAKAQKEQLQQQREQMQQQLQQQREQMQQQMTLLREQMNTTSEKLLKERAQELSSTNREQLSTILTPLQEHIRQMKEETEKMKQSHTVSLERLEASIRTNWEREKAMGEQTERLAQALTGDNKIQGNFGELRLRQILEDMGLEEGLQFEEQQTMRDEQGQAMKGDEGKKMIPDVVLHFPDNRDVIIDSKMSFTAFVDYQNATTPEERSEALGRHLQSVRSHVTELAKKQYFKYTRKEAAKLDFVVMYVFQESALQLALLNDATLWKEAYDQGVVISGSQNLYMTLRVLEMTWKQVQQVRNQENIMKCANMLIDRVQTFAERLRNVGTMLDKTRASFDELTKSTADSGQSITVAARNLLKYGAQENKKKGSIANTTEPDELPTSTIPNNSQDDI